MRERSREGVREEDWERRRTEGMRGEFWGEGRRENKSCEEGRSCKGQNRKEEDRDEGRKERERLYKGMIEKVAVREDGSEELCRWVRRSMAVANNETTDVTK